MLNHKNKFSTFCSSLKISPEMARTALIIFILVVGVTFSLMRYAAKDETGFLIEAATMSDCMLEGRWFGDEAVGWHGFLFKIPAAVLFTIFGRSIFLATFTNVIIAALTCWLCFGILRKVLKSTVWAFAGTWLVITTYHFVLSLPTFLRDIPVMFAVLLLLSAIINKRNKWLIGLCMMLILDAKEGVFFAFAPGFVLWVVLSELCSRWERSESVIRDPWSVVRNSNSDPGGVKNSTGQGNRGLKTDAEEGTVGSKQFAVSSRQLTGRGSRTSDLALRPLTSLFRFFERLFAGFFPALVFLILMFCTSVVPLNMLTATVFGVTTSGMHDMKFNFSSKRATRSLKRYMKLKDDTVKSERLKVESKTKEADPGGVEDSTGQGDGGRKTEAG
ncbi:hypothetical protein KAH27_07450, partial [bacterium]|nr:hypothetical protein [bacterium]